MIERIIEADDCRGFCKACGEKAWGVEPDARNYECESCGERSVRRTGIVKGLSMNKEQAQRLALATAAELRASRPRDRYKKRLAELVRRYKYEYRRAMIETYGAAKVVMRVPHLEVW